MSDNGETLVRSSELAAALARIAELERERDEALDTAFALTLCVGRGVYEWTDADRAAFNRALTYQSKGAK